MSLGKHKMSVGGRSIPEWLKQKDIWVVWDVQDKVPRAPWLTGHMFPAKWGSETPADERPETSFKKASMVAEMEPKAIHHNWPFPREQGKPDIPDSVEPGVILPHYPEDSPPLMFVDFDNVRDPETGVVTDEVWEIVERLDAFTEVSKSGTGLHCYVRAELPEGLGRFICPLNDEGDIEMYDHGRFTGGTWRHVQGTPETVPERQPVVDELILEYEDEQHRRRRERGKNVDNTERHVDRVLAEIRGEDVSEKGNAYFRLNVASIADTGAFSSHRRSSPGHDLQGPHPKHGAQGGTKWDSESSNFEVNDSDNCWYCHLHGVGGGPLHLIGVLEGVVSCRDAASVTSDPAKLLKACVHARDDYAGGKLDSEDPPYDALKAVAKLADLSFRDEDEERLGKDAWRLSRIVYEQLDIDDLE